VVQQEAIAENIKCIRERIRAAAARSGRPGDAVVLVAVTKTLPFEALASAIRGGCTEIGENYVQEAALKFQAVASEFPALHFRKHLIGHLQRNKAGKAAESFNVVQTVDSAELAIALGRRAVGAGKPVDVLVEVNASGEGSKNGVLPQDLERLVDSVTQVEGLRLTGLMGMAPGSALGSAGERNARAAFRRLFELYQALPTEHRQVLSMGMTGDFEWAIEEGSTMVRIGTGIFGARPSGFRRTMA
jgi:pyridoxal phosphate enzyme (YggS family)